MTTDPIELSANLLAECLEYLENGPINMIEMVDLYDLDQACSDFVFDQLVSQAEAIEEDRKYQKLMDNI